MSTAPASTRRVDSHTRITDLIVAELERGVRPWMKPWNAGRINRPLRHNGEKYTGINVVTLWMEADRRGFTSSFWLTYNQTQTLGGFVIKGEHGVPVLYAGRFTKKETDKNGQEVEREIPFMKEYTVFNAEQTKGLPLSFHLIAKNAGNTPIKRIGNAERFFTNTKADVRIGGGSAYYAEEPDYIQMPPFGSFKDSESHAATLAHELTHWTKHPSRLNRNLGRKAWGDEGYAMEELVAELASAFLCADLAITPEVREDHAAYIADWLTVLKNDKRAVLTAASHASKAVDFLHGLQPTPVI
jgi:antirestriction protein ArdC